MKLLYEANDAIEAQLIKNMLAQANIESFIHGEYLQGGIGDIQAFGLVQLLVDERHYRTAKEIIDDWNSATVSKDELKA